MNPNRTLSAISCPDFPSVAIRQKFDSDSTLPTRRKSGDGNACSYLFSRSECPLPPRPVLLAMKLLETELQSVDKLILLARVWQRFKKHVDASSRDHRAPAYRIDRPICRRVRSRSYLKRPRLLHKPRSKFFFIISLCVLYLSRSRFPYQKKKKNCSAWKISLK